MMSRMVFPALLLMATPFAAAQPPAAGAPQPAPGAPASVLDRGSYGLGVRIGRDLKGQAVKLNARMIARGILDVFEGKESMDDRQIQAALKGLQELAAAEQAKAAERNKQEGAAFLAANAKKPGVKTLPSGLQYKVLKSGNGPQPKATDRVRAHYHGTLIDGTVFDSSVKRGQPLEIPVSGVIRGWSEALQLMHVGDKWQLFIPSELAYGGRGAGSDIGPNATLIFEVELLEILK